MILVDANLLIYSLNQDAPLHAQAKRCLETALSGQQSVGFSWNVLLAVLRLTTHPRLFRNPLTPEQALDVIESWLNADPATVVSAGPRHLGILRQLLLLWGSGGNLTSDAHLAALAIEHGAELYSADSDFSRFEGLRWVNPLI